MNDCKVDYTMSNGCRALIFFSLTRNTFSKRFISENLEMVLQCTHSACIVTDMMPRSHMHCVSSTYFSWETFVYEAVLHPNQYTESTPDFPQMTKPYWLLHQSIIMKASFVKGNCWIIFSLQTPLLTKAIDFASLVYRDIGLYKSWLSGETQFILLRHCPSESTQCHGGQF